MGVGSGTRSFCSFVRCLAARCKDGRLYPNRYSAGCNSAQFGAETGERILSPLRALPIFPPGLASDRFISFCGQKLGRAVFAFTGVSPQANGGTKSRSRNRKFAQTCGWMKAKPGDELTLTSESCYRHTRAVVRYAGEILTRVKVYLSAQSSD